MNEIYLKGSILSNSEFYYRDNQRLLPEESRIPLTIELEKKTDERFNIPTRHLKKAISMKEIFIDHPQSAFERAGVEERKTKELLKIKKESKEKKAAILDQIVMEKGREIREKELKEKHDLERTLVNVIKDVLNFTKNNNPLMSMIPEKLINSINLLRDEKMSKKANVINNLGGGSLNLSFKSSKSSSSTIKYESNAFLKALGLDLNSLSVDNVKIDIDKAYDFIRKWKVSSKEEIKKIIRYKVVKEIMNVEERRSVQKVAKLSKKINTYLENTKPIIPNNNVQKKLVKSKSFLEFKVPQMGPSMNLQKKQNVLIEKEVKEPKIEEKIKVDQEKDNIIENKDKINEEVKMEKVDNTLENKDKINEEVNKEKSYNLLEKNYKINEEVNKEKGVNIKDKKEKIIEEGKKAKSGNTIEKKEKIIEEGKKEKPGSSKTLPKKELKSIMKNDKKDESMDSIKKEEKKVMHMIDFKLKENGVQSDEVKEASRKRGSIKEEFKKKEEEEGDMEELRQKNSDKKDEDEMSNNSENRDNKDEKLKTSSSINKQTIGGRTDITGTTKKTGDPSWRRDKSKQKLVYNGYKNVERICRIINSNDKLKQNTHLVKHFNNIKYNKRFDRVKNQIMSQQQIMINQNYDPVVHSHFEETQSEYKTKNTRL